MKFPATLNPLFEHLKLLFLCSENPIKVSGNFRHNFNDILSLWFDNSMWSFGDIQGLQSIVWWGHGLGAKGVSHLGGSGRNAPLRNVAIFKYHCIMKRLHIGKAKDHSRTIAQSYFLYAMFLLRTLLCKSVRQRSVMFDIQKTNWAVGCHGSHILSCAASLQLSR